MDSVSKYEEMLAIDPTSKVFVLLAEELYSRGAWDEVVKVCRRGLAFHPQHMRGRVLLGAALWKSGDTDEAEKLLAQVASEIEENLELYSILSEIAASRDDFASVARFQRIYWCMHSNHAPAPPRTLTPKPEPVQEVPETVLAAVEERPPVDEIVSPELIEPAMPSFLETPEETKPRTADSDLSRHIVSTDTIPSPEPPIVEEPEIVPPEPAIPKKTPPVFDSEAASPPPPTPALEQEVEPEPTLPETPAAHAEPFLSNEEPQVVQEELPPEDSAPPPEPPKPSVLDTLQKLLESTDEKPSQPSSRISIFDEKDRAMLREIIKKTIPAT